MIRRTFFNESSIFQFQENPIAKNTRRYRIKRTALGEAIEAAKQIRSHGTPDVLARADREIK